MWGDATQDSKDSTPAPPQLPLFRRSGKPETEAVVGAYGYEDGLIANGFHSACLVLVDALQQGRVHPHEIVYPIAFGYQQVLELTLKMLLRIASSIHAFEDQAEVERAFGVHDLKLLWNLLDGALAGIDDAHEREEAALEQLGSRIIEFHDFNPSAFAFRYSRDRGNSRYLTYNTFDLPSFSAEMEYVVARLHEIELFLIDVKSERMWSWARAVDDLLKKKLLQAGSRGADIQIANSNGITMQWTQRGSNLWVTCILRRDKRIEALFFDDSRREEGRIRDFAFVDLEGVADKIGEFLGGDR